MMNQALRNALDGYFYGDYEEWSDGEEVLQADRACYECMDVIKGRELVFGAGNGNLSRQYGP